MSEWVKTTLGEVIELKRGYDLPQKQRIAGSVPIISSSGVSDYHNESAVKGPGVVTGRYGTIGQVFYVEEDYWPLNTALYVRDFKGNDPKFISYFLRGIDFYAYSDKAAVPGVNRNHLHQAIVTVPPLAEQRAIAHVLSSLDEKINLNRRMNETLEEMSQALFKDWFVDFNPVRAKMEGREPLGLNAEAAAIFPDTLDDEGKPKGWSISSIGSEVTVVGGSTPSTRVVSFCNNGSHYWATPKDLSDLSSPVLIATERKITDLGLSQISSRLLPTGTVLLSSRAPIGYLAISQVPTAINQGFIALICDKSLPNLYVLFWCKENMDVIIGNANGSTFQEISKSNFRPIPVILPTPAIVKLFYETVEPLFMQIVENIKESQVLADMRELLLPKLLSGELRVRDIDVVPPEG